MQRQRTDRGAPGHRWRLAHHLVGALIVLGWIGLVAARLLAEDRTGFSLDRVPPPSESADIRTYSIYYKGTKIGFSESVREALDDGGARFLDRAHWRFQAQGSSQRLSMESEAILGADWSMRSFSTRIDGGVARMKASGRLNGKTLELEISTGGRVLREHVPVEGPLLVPAVLRAFVAAQAPAPGTALTIDIYNPLIRGSEAVEVVVEERTDEGWRISEIMRGSIKTTAWIDEGGATLREESFMGFRIEAEPREQALSMPEDSDNLPDLVFAATVPVRGEIGDPTAHESLTLRLLGVELDGFPLLDGGRQQLVGDRLTVRAAPLPEEAPFELPYDSEGELGEFLASAPLVQSDDAEIKATAAKILGDEQDPVAAARALSEWVHRKLRKESSVGVPSAVEVLAVKAGDCNEHTVLFTALARAAGLPARMAAGVVYADVGSGMPGMYYHAWPEVWLGDWFALDPTFGQIPADATHLRFIVGGLDQQVAILRLIGALRVEVLEAK